MATPNRGSSDVDRRASMRNSLPLSRENDIQEDLYDLEAVGVSDGFRPGFVSSGHNRMTSRTSQHTARRSTPPPRPSSATKPSNLDNFALRHDGPTAVAGSASVASSSASTASTITRTSSVSTETPYMRAESPYTGPAGPSHPYQMYPQNTRVARTASVATTSTFQPSERSYTGPTGPAHPYGMYPQNTVAVPEGAEAVNGPMVNSNIPVGFPGLEAGAQYQRRLGPDGEDAADLIGPDGHTEQLPPYSKYPDEAFARKAGLPDMEGAGGMGLATRNPEFESRDDLRSPQSRQSTHSALSEVSTHQVNGAAAELSEKPLEPRWKRIARRKVCGLIPIWVIVLVVAVILLFIIILGSVLGALVAKHNNDPKPVQKTKPAVPTSADQYITVTTTYDASAMPTLPAGLPILPLGIFSLPVVTPASTSTTCLDNSQSNAWQCVIPSTGNLLLNVSSVAGNPNTSSYALSLTVNNSLSTFSYGTQPPTLKDPQVLKIVQDAEDTGLGPAWFMQAPYDKMVIVPASVLNPSSTKRDISLDESHLERRGFVAQPGDKPWFCYWNNTLLETFIYINTTSNAGAQQAAASASSAAAAGPTPTQPSSSASYSSAYSPDGNGASGASDTYSSAKGYKRGYSISPTPTPTSPSSYGPSSSSVSDIMANLPPAGYPKIVKIEERRVPKGPQPYCVQMTISSDGMKAYPLLNSAGQQTVIFINETESGGPSKRDSFFAGLFARQSSSNSCTCAWRIT